MDIDDLIVDTRTTAEKKGEIPAKLKPPKVIQTTVAAQKQSKALTLSTAAKAKRHAARDLALDYAEWAILETVNIAKTSASDSAKIDALKLVLNYALGRPSTVHVDVDGETIVPSFTVIFGDQVQQLQIQPPEDIEDAEED